MNKKKIAVISACCLLVFGIAGGVYFLKAGGAQLPAEEKSLSYIDEPASSTVESISSSEAYSVPPIVAPPEEHYTPENTETTTQNPDGSTTTEISRPEWSKPEGTPPAEPAGPPKDETTKKDDTNSGDPNGETPETEKPADPKPEKPKPPTGGETNHKGEIYVPGFGWMPDKPSTGTGEIAENAGWKDSPVIGH